MSTERYIETLLQKYRQAPGFPFDNWVTDQVSAYALLNLWDEIFRVASGDAASNFRATAELRYDPDAMIYDVQTADFRKRFNVFHKADGGDFAVLVSWSTTDLPDRSELGMSTDLDPDRLAAAFEMIRVWAKDPFETEDIQRGFALDDAFVARYADRFTFPPPLELDLEDD